MLGRMGRNAVEGVPLRVLQQAIADIMAAIGNDELELNSATVYGTELMRVQFKDRLTPAELAAEKAESDAAKVQQAVRTLEGLRGDPTAEDVKALLALLKG
jgi:hypothetical protein